MTWMLHSIVTIGTARLLGGVVFALSIGLTAACLARPLEPHTSCGLNRRVIEYYENAFTGRPERTSPHAFHRVRIPRDTGP